MPRTRHHRPARTVLVAALPLVGLLAACSAEGSTSAGPSTPATSMPAASAPPLPVTVDVKVFQFTPAAVTVPAGTPVVFVNGDDTTHEPLAGTPGAATGAFDLPLVGLGARDQVTLPVGRHPYFCVIHDHMRGEIVVSG